jgi:type IV pilus assembly protein PilA
MTHPRRSAPGFTLIELMIVVAIIGVLASVAVPAFGMLTLRAKAAERHEVLQRVKKAVADYYLQHGSMPDDFQGEWQPPWPPETSKRVPDWKTPGWEEVFRTSEEVQGALYYSYRFYHRNSSSEPGGEATLYIYASGDLDGDGLTSDKTLMYTRLDGAYQVLKKEHEVPEAGAEDGDTF